MPKPFVITDESINSHGFYLLNKGADLTLFEKNPIMLWMHNRAWRGTKEEVLPIGTVENVRFNEKKQRWEGDPVFDMEDEFAAEIGRKWEAGVLRMVSAGVRPVEWSEDKELMKKGQTRPTLTKWILREVSVVDIGANYNSLAFYDEKGEFVNLSDLSDKELEKHMPNLIDNQKNDDMDTITLSDKTKLTADDIQNMYDKSKTDAQSIVTLTGERNTLQTANNALNLTAKTAAQADFVKLFDAARKDGRVDAKPDGDKDASKESWLSFFDKDPEAATKALAAIPKRSAAAAQLKDGEGDPTEREELAKLNWDQLNEQNKLETLKENHRDLFDVKFEEKYKCKPNK